MHAHTHNNRDPHHMHLHVRENSTPFHQRKRREHIEEASSQATARSQEPWSKGGKGHIVKEQEPKGGKDNGGKGKKNPAGRSHTQLAWAGGLLQPLLETHRPSGTSAAAGGSAAVT